MSLETDTEAFDKAQTLFFSGQYKKAAETFAACAASSDISDNLKIQALSWQYHVASVHLKDKAMAGEALSQLKQLNAAEQFAVGFNGDYTKKLKTGGKK